MQNLPKVKVCDVTECCYNRNKECHAGAIQVGDAGPTNHPACDTFTQGGNKCGVDRDSGNIGACKVQVCTFNNNLECNAPNIHVGHHSGHADCMTFRPR